ncbi:MAG: hypothetical protein V1921_03355 [Candidatus Altiarchaeota archaeon]
MSSEGQEGMVGEGLGYFIEQLRDYARENSMVALAAVIGVIIITIYVVSTSWSNLSWVFGK